MKKIQLTFILLLLTALGSQAQIEVVSGTVVDAHTHKPIAGASVTMAVKASSDANMSAASIHVVTNEDGFFTLKSSQKGSTLVVTHLGYHSQHLTPNTQHPLLIQLKPAAIQLHEILVMPDNARELVMAAIHNIPNNYSQQPEIHHTFYREKVMKRQNYINVAEGVIDMYKTSYSKGIWRDRAAIRKGRRLISPRQRDTLSVKVMGGPATALVLDIVKNTDFLLNSQELNLYDLRLQPPATIADRLQLVVSLTPRTQAPYPLYYGTFYIDQETLAFTRIELQLDMRDRNKATSFMLVKKPRGLRFRPREMSCILDYRRGDDGLMRITYLRNTFRFNCDWQRRRFATSFTAVCEMAVTNITNHNVEPIRGRDSFDQHDAFFDKVDYFRDSTFWKDYNIIEPNESLDKALNKLLPLF